MRVYLPAKDQTCQGSVYSDDGHTLEYRQGNYYRVNATCKLAPDGTITVTLEATEGSYRPPWKSLRVELVGTPRAPTEALMSGKKLPLTLNNGLPGATFRTLSKSTQILFR